MSNTIPFDNTDLSSRSAAATVRRNIGRLLKQNTLLQFDLKNVESISLSYADELFGILTVENGVDQLVNQIRVINAQPHVLRTIAEAIKARETTPRGAAA